LKFYAKALLKLYGQKKMFFPTGRRGRPRKPKVVPSSGLKYAKIVKQRENGYLKKVDKKIIFGKNIEAQLISTSLIERLNLTLRQTTIACPGRPLGSLKRSRS